MLRRLLAAGWGQALSALLQLVALRFYTQWMAPEPFGLAMLALGTLALADGLGAMAFAQALARLLKDHAARDQRIGLALGLALPFTGWVLVLALGGLCLAWAWLGAAGMLLCAIGALAMIATEGLRNAGQVVAQLERRFTLVSAWAAAEAMAVLACSIAALQLTAVHPAALPVGLLFGRALTALGFAPLALGPPRTWRPDRAAAAAARPEALRFGWQVALMAPLGWFGIFADRFIVGATTGLGNAGIIAALTGAVVRPFAIASLGLTNLYRPDLLDEESGRAPLHDRPLRAWLLAAFAIGLAGIAGFALLGPVIADFLLRFPTPGVNAGGLMVLIAVSQAMVLLTHAVDNRLLAQGRSQPMLAAQLAVMVLGLLLIALGASWLGLVGAALGRCANEALKLAAAWAVLQSAWGQRERRAAHIRLD